MKAREFHGANVLPEDARRALIKAARHKPSSRGTTRSRV